MKAKHRIEWFKKTLDYRDICYFIDHVSNPSVRVDILQQMGYRIGVNITTDETDDVKGVIIGRQGEARMQVTPKYERINISRCVVVNADEFDSLKIL